MKYKLDPLTIFSRLVTIALLSQWKIHTTSAQDYTCDLAQDECPTSQDGVCDSLLGNTPSPDPFCRQGDCIDCNFCQEFNYDCNGCLNAIGCYWCPGDGICNNSPLYVYEDGVSTCTAADDYIASPNVTACTTEENFFRYDFFFCFSPMNSGRICKS